MSVFKGNLAEQTVFIRIERSRPEAIDGIIVRNNPVNFIDPWGLKWYNDWHYNRNDKLPAGSPPSHEFAEQHFHQVPALYHQQNGATDNVKFVSPWGSDEYVYNGQGDLVTDPANRGTYNYFDPTMQPLRHFLGDMLPYYLWGNSPDDPTPWWNRLTGPDNSCP